MTDQCEKEPHYPERNYLRALLPVVGQDAMIPVGDNDTSISGPHMTGKCTRLRKNVAAL